MNPYARTPAELRMKASLFWPKDLTSREAQAGIIPILLETQSKFISLLSISDAGPEAWKIILQCTANITSEILLAHLMVLSDINPESAKHLSDNIAVMFPSGSMRYTWRGQTYSYKFALPQIVHIDNEHRDYELTEVKKDFEKQIEDLIMILLFGSFCEDKSTLEDSVLEKCFLGRFLGYPLELELLAKQRYIHLNTFF